MVGAAFRSITVSTFQESTIKAGKNKVAKEEAQKYPKRP